MPPCSWQASLKPLLAQQGRTAGTLRCAERQIATIGRAPSEPQAGDARVELDDRHVDRAGDVPGVPLGERAHVDELRHGGAVVQQAIKLPR